MTDARRRLPTAALPALLMWLVPLAPVHASETEGGVPPARIASPRVGEATAGLLALQRDGAAASAVPRPIPGEVAGRSYQRHLRSFEYPIPERYGASIGGAGAAGASGIGTGAASLSGSGAGR